MTKGDAKVLLKLEFSEGAKKANILVNNNEIKLDTTQTSYSKDISTLVKSDDNSIKITTTNAFTINTLKVSLE